MIPDVVALWIGRIVAWIWIGIAAGILGTGVYDWARYLWRRRQPPQQPQIPASWGACVDALNQHDLGDETDAVPEGGTVQWPRLEEVIALQGQYPRLKYRQAWAVAIAKTRLRTAR